MLNGEGSPPNFPGRPDRASRSGRVTPVHARRLRRALGAGLATALVALLALAPTAMAADGVGLWGRTDDKVVTYFCFAVMGFFTVLVIVLSLIQIRLEGRKERAREQLERLRGP
jgi:hypothetical protein